MWSLWGIVRDAEGPGLGSRTDLQKFLDVRDEGGTR